MFRNNGDNTFTDVTADAGVKCDLLSTSSAFADIDQDGDLDLYVCNYVGYSLDSDIPCYYQDMRIYCGPNDYQGIEDTLYLNNGDGRFTDVTQVSLTYIPDTRWLGVVFTDLNNDGLLDLIIGNETTNGPIYNSELYHNNGDGTFTEKSRSIGLNIFGFIKAVVWGDIDNDGDTDLYIVNGADLPGCVSPVSPTNILYRNNGNGTFTDMTKIAGVGNMQYGVGCAAADYDNDGDVDLYTVSYTHLTLPTILLV